MESLMGDVDIAKFVMGKHAFHIPINLIAQKTDGAKVAGVWQTCSGLPLLGNSQKYNHVLTLGDMIFRPRLMIGVEKAFCGMGIASLYKDGFADPTKWLREGEIIVGVKQ
jgi:hypothetical protein